MQLDNFLTLFLLIPKSFEILLFKFMFHIFVFIYSSFTGILRTHNMTSSQLP